MKQVPDPSFTEENSNNDLKAQEDLLALKMLGDPHFLDRVPYLIPAEEMYPGEAQQHQLLGSEQVMDDLAQEVKRRVLAELDLILPELIASCMSEVLTEASKGRDL